MRRLQGIEWRNMRDRLDIMYYDQVNSLGHICGHYRHKITDEIFIHWLNDDEILELDEPFRDIEPMDLLFIDIAPDDCGGVVVPRIPETLDELYDVQARVCRGEIILRGFVPHEHIMKGVQWL